MTDTELAPLPAAPDATPPDPWAAQFEQLRARFPGAQPSVLFCVHALQQQADIELEDLKAQAALHGHRVTGASLNAARRLLGLAPDVARKPRPAKPEAEPGPDLTAAWDQARHLVEHEFPHTTDGIRYCVYRLRREPKLGLRELRGDAAALGIRLGGRALHSARVLLGMVEGRAAKPAQQPRTAKPRTAAGRDATEETVLALRDAMLAQQREIARLRGALERIRRAVAEV